jgi:hypothetical protein
MNNKFYNKIKDWCNRYLLAEIISYSFTIWSWSLVFYITNNYYLSWLVVIVWDYLWYYLTIFIKEILNTRRISKCYNFKLFLKDFRNLVFEFWWPQFMETFIIYPLSIFYIPQLFDNYSIWAFIAMTIVVITFYVQAIVLYEIRKKYFN